MPLPCSSILILLEAFPVQYMYKVKLRLRTPPTSTVVRPHRSAETPFKSTDFIMFEA